MTDPTAEYPQGRTPADLASYSGHKGISGFVAESSLTTHLSTLQLKDDGVTEGSGLEAVRTVSERLAVPTTGEDVPDTLSLKDSLAAVCNATQAAARIHQIFRIQSFQRKQLDGRSDDLLTPEEQAVVAAKSSRLGHSDGMANAAALQIQKKYRGWKTRKEFLVFRQKIVKIQVLSVSTLQSVSLNVDLLISIFLSYWTWANVGLDFAHVLLNLLSKIFGKLKLVKRNKIHISLEPIGGPSMKMKTVYYSFRLQM